MNQPSTPKRALRKQVLAALSVPLAMTSGGVACAQEPGAQTGGAQWRGGPVTPRVYSVINLAPDNLGAYLNEQGQAAFSSFVRSMNSYFDGDRLHDFASLDLTLIRGLNNRGTVTGLTNDDARPFSNVRAFSWTLAGGLRLLPGLGAFAYDINDRNQIVGSSSDRLTSTIAARWDADGRLRLLLPRPPSQSTAHAINNRGIAGGFADVAVEGPVQAVLWDPAGRQTALGSMGGTWASAGFLNERGDAAGQVYGGEDDPVRAFFWNARSGMASLASPDMRNLYVNDLNDQGNIAGIVQARNAPSTDHSAFRWSRARGLEWLTPRTGPGIVTDVTDLNNRNQMVGSVERPGARPRAVRWDWTAAPLDLNTRLHRPPAGLVLQSGRAINEAGTILAESNAGLVMLRPGTRGTDAPVLGPVTGLSNTGEVGQVVRGSVGFVDNSASEVHRAVVTWSDNCRSPQPLVREAGGVGRVTFQHRFCKAGAFQMTVQVRDSGGRATRVGIHYYVDETGVPAISGQGVLGREGGSGMARGAQALRFVLWAPLAAARAGTADIPAAGTPVFRLAGSFRFESDHVGAPARNGGVVRLEGTGRFNGRAGYRFLAEASDGAGIGQAGADRMRVRISHGDPAGAEVVDYDNGPAPADALSPAATATDRTRLAQGDLAVRD